jgi:glycolate dehydrogenase FAD-binding subunit
VTTTAEIAGRVREAAAAGTPIRIVGHGSWLAANRPVQADAALALDACSGIVDYVPGDFTLTVRAGTPLVEIARVAAQHGQWLPLDPLGSDAGSIGATVATASCGPHATGFGSPRNHLLGLEFVTGAGDVVRGGGRVVKNVAGFDLVRLSAGAWGTLGVITEVTVRLRSLPPEEQSLVVAVEDDEATLDRLGVGLRRMATAPLACELIGASLAEDIDLPARPALAVHIGGNSESMRAQRDALAALGAGPFTPVDDGLWARLRVTGDQPGAAWRLSHGPSRFGRTWMDGCQSVSPFPGARMHGSPLRGVVRCFVPRGDSETASPEALLRSLMLPFEGARIGETLPAHVWSVLPSAAMDHLSRGVRAAFDPRHILNRGILGAGE